MDMTQIEHFLALSRTLNFTRAAAACDITQPAFTRSIQRLENELGGPLLLRERNLTQLTELGRVLLPLLSQAFYTMEQARAEAVRLKQRLSAPLRLGITPAFSWAPFMPLIIELEDKLPGLQVALQVADRSALEAALLAGELDAVLVPGEGDGGARLHHWTLFEDAPQLVVPAGHALAVVPEVSASMLAGLRLIGLSSQDCPCPDRPAVMHRGSDLAQQHQMILAGLGVGLCLEHVPLPAGLVGRSLAAAPRVGVGLAIVAGRPLNRSVSAFVMLARARSWARMAAA